MDFYEVLDRVVALIGLCAGFDGPIGLLRQFAVGPIVGRKCLSISRICRAALPVRRVGVAVGGVLLVELLVGSVGGHHVVVYEGGGLVVPAARAADGSRFVRERLVPHVVVVAHQPHHHSEPPILGEIIGRCKAGGVENSPARAPLPHGGRGLTLCRHHAG